MVRSYRLFAAVAAVFVLGAGRAAAEPYRNDKHNFDLELPASWRSLTPKELTKFNKIMNDAAGEDAVAFIAGFIDTDGDLESAPILMIQLDTDVAGMSYEHFEKEFTRDVAAKTNKARRFRTTLGTPEFDKERKRFTCRGKVATSTGRLAITSVGYLRKEGLFILHMLCREKHLEKHTPTFVRLGDSFRTDDEEKPAVGGSEFFKKTFAGVEIGETERMWLVGGGVTIVVLLVGAIVLRGK